MASSSTKKHVPKGVRLGWASIKEAKLAKLTIKLTSIKGVNISAARRASGFSKVNAGQSSNTNYLIP